MKILNRMRKTIFGHSLCFVLVSLIFISPKLSAKVVTGTDAETGLQFHQWQREGVSIRLVQRLPDQTRAFFQGRGFSPETADVIGQACVFQTIFRNDGNKAISYDLSEWNVHHDGKTAPVAVRESWDKRWKDEDVSQAARIALRWSLLPTQQSFQPGDYNWGMTAYGLPPGSVFDLTIAINIDGQRTIGRIAAIRCAADK